MLEREWKIIEGGRKKEKKYKQREKRIMAGS